MTQVKLNRSTVWSKEVKTANWDNRLSFKDRIALHSSGCSGIGWPQVKENCLPLPPWNWHSPLCLVERDILTYQKSYLK